MQKWEYGFLEYGKEVLEKDGLFKQIGYREIIFNKKAIMKVDINDKSDVLPVAFNMLGNMGWELATYSVAYSSTSSYEGSTLRNQTIIFKRQIE